MSAPLHERITRLAEDLSSALAEHDDGQWGLDIRPAHNGRPIFGLIRDDVPPRLRVEQFSGRLCEALRDCRQGDWETSMEMDRGYLLFARPNADLSPLAKRVQGDDTVSVRVT